MQNKNSKSDGYIVRKAENIIEDYLNNRELSNINKYYQLKEKYEKLRIVTLVTTITFVISTLLNIFF